METMHHLAAKVTINRNGYALFPKRGSKIDQKYKVILGVNEHDKRAVLQIGTYSGNQDPKFQMDLKHLFSLNQKMIAEKKITLKFVQKNSSSV